jgi:hypothetical protein
LCHIWQWNAIVVQNYENVRVSSFIGENLAKNTKSQSNSFAVTYSYLLYVASWWEDEHYSNQVASRAKGFPSWCFCDLFICDVDAMIPKDDAHTCTHKICRARAHAKNLTSNYEYTFSVASLFCFLLSYAHNDRGVMTSEGRGAAAAVARHVSFSLIVEMEC